MDRKLRQALLLGIAIMLVSIAGFWGQFTGAATPAKASALFQSPLPTVPNDNFTAAQVVNGLPFHAETDITYATVETSEPTPSCYYNSPIEKSIWYAYTPTTSGSVLARAEGWGAVLGVYRGNSLNSLTALTCLSYWNQFSFRAEAGVTYYFQLSSQDTYNYYVGLTLEVPPPPQASFYYGPYDPSIYDQIYFYDNSHDPGNSGWQSGSWNFGDGSSSTEFYAYHQYAVDGDYSVTHTVTTNDGRSGSITKVVQIRTRDVYISKMARPNSASVNQTKRIVVSVTDKRYPQLVRVELHKSVPGSYQQIGYLEQQIGANRTVDFYFSYTFTAADAQAGKVNFKAVAILWDGRDAFPGDNEFISLPVTVSGRTGRSALDGAGSDDLSQYAVDEVSNTAADGPLVGTDSQLLYRAYMPLIKQ